MARKALGSKQDAAHAKVVEGNKAKKAAEERLAALAQKTFEELTSEDKDLLLKILAVRFNLIQPS